MPTVTKQTRLGNRNSKLLNKKGVISRISPIEFENDGIKICVYGRSGTGKTTFWATFPKPILAVICSGGKHSGELRSINTPEYKKTVKNVSLNESSELTEVIDHQLTTGEYKTLVLDHASGFQDLVLKEVLGLDKVPEQLSWGLASQQEYGQVALQVKTYFRSLLDLACNVVIVGQERDFNTEAESSVLSPFVAPALSPSIVGWLLPACDYVVQTFLRKKTITKETKIAGKVKIKTVPTDQVEYCLRTGPDDVYSTKFRVPKGRSLPNYLVNADYEQIKKLIG